MAIYVTLDDIKRQVNVEHSDDDKLLQDMIDEAEEWVEKTIQQPLADLEASDTATTDQAATESPDDNTAGAAEAVAVKRIPKPLRRAILIYAATLYANREAVAYGQPVAPPYNLMSLITPYIKFR